MTDRYSLKPASFAVDTHMTLLWAARRQEPQRASPGMEECESDAGRCPIDIVRDYVNHNDTGFAVVDDHPIGQLRLRNELTLETARLPLGEGVCSNSQNFSAAHLDKTQERLGRSCHPFAAPVPGHIVAQAALCGTA